MRIAAAPEAASGPRKQQPAHHAAPAAASRPCLIRPTCPPRELPGQEPIILRFTADDAVVTMPTDDCRRVWAPDFVCTTAP